MENIKFPPKNGKESKKHFFLYLNTHNEMLLQSECSLFQSTENIYLLSIHIFCIDYQISF